MSLLYVIGTFIAMEGITWCTHRFVMHGFLWYFHEDHHRPQPGFFEKNDAFFLVFALPSFLMMLYGANSGFDWRFQIGTGIMLYGFSYFMIHDVLIHRRFHWFDKTDNLYFRAIRKAHKVHHKHLDKADGECFGMLWVPLKYFREAASYKKKKQNKVPSTFANQI